MIAPFPLYVDEISPDKIKATVSTASTAIYNIRTMSLDMPSPHRDSLFNGVNGIVILPVGKFICMLVRDYSNISMIILDLIGKEELAEKMAEKLGHVDLQEKFMNVYKEVVSHPEKHNRFRLVAGKPEVLGNLS